MAVAVSGAFLADVHQLRPQEQEYKSWRLPSNHIADLRDVARGIEESNAGVCCRYLIDHLTAADSMDIDPDGYINSLDAVEKFCDQFGVWKNPTVITWRRRIQRSRRALALMHEAGDDKAVGVLHIVYGYPDPFTHSFLKKTLDQLGELASLAKYTDLVEVRRQEMARQQALVMSQREVKIAPTKDIGRAWRGVDVKKDEIKHWFDDRVQTGDERTRRAIIHEIPVDYAEHPQMIDMMKHRDLYEYSLKSISSADAFRLHTFVPSPRDDREAADEGFKERRDIAEARRESFVSLVKIEADKLLTEASKKYHASWLTVGSCR